MINRSAGAGLGGRTAQQVEQRRRPAHRNDRLEHDQFATGLRESERLYRTTFERAVVGIAHTSPEGRWLRFNQQFCDLLGYTRAELATRTFQDVTYPDDLDASLACLRRMVAGEQDSDALDKRYVRKDDAVVWVHVTVSLVRTPKGEPDYFITMVQDITERQRLETERERLLEQERAARREAEAANARLCALQALTDIALSHLALDDLLRELLGRVTAVTSVDTAGIFLLDADGRTLTLRAVRGLGEEEVGRLQFPMGQGFVGRIAASRAPVSVDAGALCAADFAGAQSSVLERLRAVAGVPLLVAGPAMGLVGSPVEGQGEECWLVGVLAVGSATSRRFSEQDIALLQRAADRIALAIDRAHLYAAEQEARHQAEASLARAVASEAQATERAERLHTILETMTEGVAVYDAEGRPVQMNRAYREVLALERGPTVFEALPALDRAGLLDPRDATTGAPLPLERIPVVRALRGEVVTGSDADLRLRAFDGRDLEVNASSVPMREPEQGRIMGAITVLRDRTERLRLEREREVARADELVAREASRRMEGFLAAAAHDLRSPLTATVGYIELARRQSDRLAAAAREECPDLARRVEAVRDRERDADQSAERLTRMLTMLFDTAAIQTDKLELHRAPRDLTALVREQVAALRVAAPGRTLRLHLPENGEQPILVEADADRIGQVVTNYVTNALKYSPPDQPVDVSVVARGGRARVAVCDQGPGIPKEERARVWELFHRVPGVVAQGGTSAVMQGTSLGLGLHISEAIITAHGGRVGVTSAVGKGSTFWFTLPLSGSLPGHADAAAERLSE